MANSAQFSYDKLLEAIHLKVDDTQVDVEWALSGYRCTDTQVDVALALSGYRCTDTQVEVALALTSFVPVCGIGRRARLLASCRLGTHIAVSRMLHRGA